MFFGPDRLQKCDFFFPFCAENKNDGRHNNTAVIGSPSSCKIQPHCTVAGGTRRLEPLNYELLCYNKLEWSQRVSIEVSVEVSVEVS